MMLFTLEDGEEGVVFLVTDKDSSGSHGATCISSNGTDIEIGVYWTTILGGNWTHLPKGYIVELEN